MHYISIYDRMLEDLTRTPGYLWGESRRKQEDCAVDANEFAKLKINDKPPYESVERG